MDEELDIVVTGFDVSDRLAEAGLTRVFGLNAQQARRFVRDVPFVAKREQYWNALSESEQALALDVGRPLYEEYRDEVAQERLERKLEKAKRKITGSRTGFVGFLTLVVAGPGGVGIAIDGERFYDDTYWEPDQYWEWQDSIWKDPAFGTVTVEPLEVVRDGAATGE